MVHFTQIFTVVPASDPKKLRKLKDLAADLIVLDLEDGVAPAQKHSARQNIAELSFPDPSRLAIRINDTRSKEFQLDLPLLQEKKGLFKSVVVPKVESYSDLIQLHSFGSLHASIESPKSLLNLSSICQSAGLASLIVLPGSTF